MKIYKIISIKAVLIVVGIMFSECLWAQKEQSFKFEYKVEDFQLVKDSTGETMIYSSQHDLFYPELADIPAVPYVRVSIVVSPDEELDSVKFVFSGNTEITNVNLASVPIPIEMGKERIEQGKKTYSHSSYPIESQRGYFLSMGMMDGFKILNFVFSPFQYDVSNQKLILSSSVEMKLVTKSLEKKNNVGTKNTMQFVLPSLVKNSEQVEDNLKSAKSFPEWGDGYLIICPKKFETAFQRLAEWKKKKGLRAEIVTLESIYEQYTGEKNYIKIKRCIKDYYQHRNLKYVLLGGDGTQVPVVYCDYLQIPSDWFYACLDEDENFAFDWNANGNAIIGENIETDRVDLYPEVIVTRAPVESSIEANIFVDKTLKYELNPPENDWYKEILFAGASIRYYAETKSELIDAELNARYYYDNGIKNQFPAKTTFYFGKRYTNCITTEKMQQKLQQEGQFIYMLTHGTTDAFALSDSITPHNDTIHSSYQSEDALQMTKETPCILISPACTTNAFDKSRCLGRHFLINPDNGVTVYIGMSHAGHFWGKEPLYGGIFTDFYHLTKTIFDKEYHGMLGEAFYASKANSINNMFFRNLYGLNFCGDPELQIYLSKPSKFTTSLLKEGDDFVFDAGIDNCTFMVRYSGIGKRQEYIKNTRYYKINSKDILNCEITLTHDNYIPSTVVFNPRYVQNKTFTKDTKVEADVIVAGREVTDKEQYGDVIIQSGKTIFTAAKGIILEAGFEVKEGAAFETIIKP